jgi:hypothetical protein
VRRSWRSLPAEVVVVSMGLPQGALLEAPVRVVVAGPGKQLFEKFGDRRVREVSPAEALAAGVELIVIPCGSSPFLELPEPDLPPELWAAAKGVVFDASAEGREHKPQRTEVLHRMLEATGVDPDRVVYLTQERNYRAEYRAHCATVGLRPMAVLEHDYWIWRFAAQFIDGAPLLRERLAEFRARATRRERRFVSLNFTPRPTKVLFLLSLIRDGLWDQGYISFGGFDRFEKAYGQDKAEFSRVMKRQPGFQDLARQLMPLLDTLDSYGQVVFGWVIRDHRSNHIHKAPLLDRGVEEYNRSWFSVITETEMRGRPSRITEKPLKPLANFHPLISFGNPGSLEMIRELGFVTFEEMIDERYDLEPDPRRRFDMVYAEVKRLCALDEAELARLEAKIADKLEHNARWVLFDMPRVRKAQHDRALLDAILASVREKAPAG